jgi:phytol kinase
MSTLIQRFAGFFPDASTILAVTPIALLWSALAAVVVARLRRRGMRVPYTRKLFHFAIFTAATVVQLVWGLPGVASSAVVSAGAAAVLRGGGHPTRRWPAPDQPPHLRSSRCSPPRSAVVWPTCCSGLRCVGYLGGWETRSGTGLARWGGALSSAVHGGRKCHAQPEGSVAVLSRDPGRLIGLPGQPTAAGSCGDGGRGRRGQRLVEAVSTHGLDNLTVQVTASAAAWLVGR